MEAEAHDAGVGGAIVRVLALRGLQARGCSALEQELCAHGQV